MIGRILQTTLFQRSIVGAIVLAGIVAGLETSPALMNQYGARFAVLDRLILGLFIVEALLKMAAHGRHPWRYFLDGWNVFDFLILVLCLIPVGGPFASVFRMARALRLLRLVSTLPKLQLLVSALLKSLSAMGYVGLLLALLFYIYAVAGIHLLGGADPQNFGTFPAALLSLFRIVTLDNWGDLFLRALEGVSGVKVTLYFVSFIVLGTMIILNLFIGIIMNSMTEAHSEQAKDEPAPRSGTPDESITLARLTTATEQLAVVQTALAELKEELRRQRPPSTT